MKLVILVPSPEYKNYAGARIRYQRIAPQLAKRRIDLAVKDINSFVPHESDADVVIVSKCHDPLSLVVAAIMAKKGCLVGVDLFDDYFSQTADSRMSKFRNWLRQILASCDFVLCSTKAMAEVAKGYRPGIPTHVMNDPAADLKIDELPEVLARKLEQARESLKIRVAWFGVGDNPHFPVGLRDLAAFGSALGAMRSGGFDVEVQVLTNRRALTASGLAAIEGLPVRTAIEEWTEEAEQQLLADSFVAFLPVNEQPFSTAKSLNRAVTALTSGCQVLSVGYELYEPLAALVYRDATALIRDIGRGEMQLSPTRMAVYREVMDQVASADAEAARLGEFLSDLQPGTPKDGTLVLLHGNSTSGAAHKLVQAAHGLSVASPCCSASLGFDVIFQATASGLAMRVSEKTARGMQLDREKLSGAFEFGGRRFIQPFDDRTDDAIAVGKVPLPLQLAGYGAWMEEMRERMTRAFGPCSFMIAENSSVPFAFAE